MVLNADRRTLHSLGPPVAPFYPFFGEGSPTKIDYRKNKYPYSILSTGGPSFLSHDLIIPRLPSPAYADLIDATDENGNTALVYAAAKVAMPSGAMGYWMALAMLTPYQ